MISIVIHIQLGLRLSSEKVSVNMPYHVVKIDYMPMSSHLQKLPIVSIHMRALVLTLSVCYHTRLLNRVDFEKMLVIQLSKTKEFRLPKGVRLQDEIAWYA